MSEQAVYNLQAVLKWHALRPPIPIFATLRMNYFLFREMLMMSGTLKASLRTEMGQVTYHMPEVGIEAASKEGRLLPGPAIVALSRLYKGCLSL